jgi:hypothetical protein
MAGRKPTSTCTRFVEKCAFNGTGCIEWTGATTPNGYGVFHVGPRKGGRMHIAHRWLFEQAYGPQLADIDVCHRCDNPCCVNIDHLFAGTRKQNMEDAVRKGRTSHVARNKGEKHPMRKLNAAKVADIRALRALGATLKFISSLHGVSLQQVHRIVTNQSWRIS